MSQNRNPDNVGQPTPAWGGYSQPDSNSMHVQQPVHRNVPYHGQPYYEQPFGFTPEPQYQPKQPPIAPRKPTRPPYPSHLARFPAELIGFGKRRSRGPSFWRMVYLGTHPIALLMTLFLFMIMVEFIAGWIALVFSCWLLWVMFVTAAWACQVAVSALRR